MKKFRKYQNIETHKIVEAEIIGSCAYLKLTKENLGDFEQKNLFLSRKILMGDIKLESDSTTLIAVDSEKFLKEFKEINKSSKTELEDIQPKQIKSKIGLEYFDETLNFTDKDWEQLRKHKKTKADEKAWTRHNFKS